MLCYIGRGVGGGAGPSRGFKLISCHIGPTSAPCWRRGRPEQGILTWAMSEESGGVCWGWGGGPTGAGILTVLCSPEGTEHMGLEEVPARAGDLNQVKVTPCVPPLPELEKVSARAGDL